MFLDYVLRSITLIILIITRLFWYLAKRKTNLSKPSAHKRILRLEQIAIICGSLFVSINLIGFSIFTFENTSIQIFGFFLVLLGCSEAIISRLTLDNNWTSSYQFQIKKDHKLVENGIYSFVRHPIYGGFLIAGTGAFMVSKTYLFFPIFLLLIFFMMLFSKREENLLIKHFGKEYKQYIKKTKMFIPFIY